ncbi:MAG TPA: hypothetical protein VLF90_00295 [Patescibacteria group bacterium]|nr:hypothetical protein [Patescibacteria group bacterium]
MTLEVIKGESVQGNLTPEAAYVKVCKLMGGEPLLGDDRREKVLEFFEDIMGFSAVVGITETHSSSTEQNSSEAYSEVQDSDDPSGLGRATSEAIETERGAWNPNFLNETTEGALGIGGLKQARISAIHQLEQQRRI